MEDGPKAPVGALEHLATRSTTSFPSLLAARDRSQRGLRVLESDLRELRLPGQTSVVLLGSWGRAEVTEVSDLDWLLVDASADRAPEAEAIPRAQLALDPELPGTPLAAHLGDLAEIMSRHGASPGSQGTFATQVHVEDLAGRIGLDEDSNRNLTQRMLLLLESVPATGAEHHRTPSNAYSPPTSTAARATTVRRGSSSTTSSATGARSPSTSKASAASNPIASGRCATSSCAPRARSSSPAACSRSSPAATSKPIRWSASCSTSSARQQPIASRTHFSRGTRRTKACAACARTTLCLRDLPIQTRGVARRARIRARSRRRAVPRAAASRSRPGGWASGAPVRDAAAGRGPPVRGAVGAAVAAAEGSPAIASLAGGAAAAGELAPSAALPGQG